MWILSGKVIVALVWAFWMTVVGSTAEGNPADNVILEPKEIREEYNFREKGSDVVLTNFAAHLYSTPFAKLARHPRMIQPVEDLLQEK